MIKNYFFLLVSFFCISASAQNVTIPDANFKQFLLNHVPVIDANDDNEIQISEALTVTELFASSLNISDLTGIQAFTNLTLLNVEDNNLTEINVTGLVNLSTLNVNSNNLNLVNLGNADNLVTLAINNNQLTTLDLSGKTIVFLSCQQNQLTAINLQNANIQEIRCQNNQLEQLDLSDLVNLTEINCSNNQITSIDFSNNEILSTVDCTANPILHLDFGNNPYLFEVACMNPVLETISLKNGASSTIYLDYLDPAPNLLAVCTDTEDIAYFSANFQAFDFPPVHVSSYCTFTPGGKHNIITGTCRVDVENDGCSALDAVLPNLRLNITDDFGGEGAVFTTQDGVYNFYTATGNYIVEPVSPSPYYSFTPTAPVISFGNNNSNTTVQDFCLAASGIHQDLEISIVSIIPARPGFNAVYMMYYKNKGTQTMSGTVNLQFNDNLMDFASALPDLETQGEGSLDWTFTNLQPLETRNIRVTMLINSPMTTPAVNIGDELVFTATVSPVAGDETPGDNVAQLQQIVVGSFDPNDITCQEGAAIAVEQVGEYLHYLIRFQNSGTFYAENVVVKNVIDESDFDLSSFEVIGASHPLVTRLTENIAEFIFEGINLPAESDNEPGSHGYIAFRIKTNNGLVIGDTFAQLADIFFDYNFPITTNPAITSVTALGVSRSEISGIALYPNPVKNKLTVLSNDNMESIQLYDLQGRLLFDQYVGAANFVLDISDRKSGIYLIKVETARGTKTEMVVKE